MTQELSTTPNQSVLPIDHPLGNTANSYAVSQSSDPVAAAASGTNPVLTVGGTTNFALGSGPKVIAPSLTVTGDTTTVIDGARVIINAGFDQAGDKLLVGDSTATSGTLASGIQYNYDTTSGVLTFTGNGTTANYEAALRSVKFDSSSTSTTARSVDFSLGTRFYLSSNGHFYGFIPVTIPNQPDKGISWLNAKAEAESDGSKFYNLTGYLATITDQAEQDFINDKIRANGWIGGSDQETEGVWKWETGPEKGTIFWNGQGATFGNPKGTPVSGTYSNWSPGTGGGNDEPNDRQANEDYAHIIGNDGAGTIGKWNDLANDFDYSSAKPFQVQGYIIEYGDKTTDANYPKIVGTVGINIGAIANPDFNKDKQPEIVWRNFGTPQQSGDSGRNAVWVLDYDKNATGATNPFKLNEKTKFLRDTISDLGWEIEGTQDFNKDDITDLFWHNSNTDQTAIWIMKNDTSPGGSGIEIDKGYFFYTVPNKNWEVEAVKDFDSDGNQNVLWRNYTTGENAIWSIAYDANNTSNPFSLDSSKTKFIKSAENTWTMEGWEDFNKDGISDILWHNEKTGENAIWALNANASGDDPYFASAYDLTNTGKGSGWRVEGAIDFNNDGVSDIVWHNKDGSNAIWLMKNGADYDQAYLILSTDLKWEIEGVADFTQDNIPDLLWRNYATGENAIWRMKLEGGKALLDQGFFITEAKDLYWEVQSPTPNNQDSVAAT
ncbi:lectin-like protein [Calothrix sp. PCC 6303]|uniref:lectin-like protein n=1 Tax=Calothrix sp. PCC 6303 TaxID=1170562 RepID=UPI0002A0560F|nr:lectin-like protein [Calothrix sp. PCC 6303]AFZ02575.1 C-type lectin domain protein [Calothrix sp. PCC 6303]